MKAKLSKIDFLQILLIALLIVSATYLHYQTDPANVHLHVVFREFYFLPIIMAGFWYGLVGGLSASLTITLLYLPFVLSFPATTDGHYFGNIMQILLFNLIGFIVGWLRDQDKKKQMKLLEAEHLAAMGSAVSCIAHDMKTPLMAIGGFVHQVRRKIEDDRHVRKLEMAVTQVKRLETLVGDMLAFARPLDLQLQQGRIESLLEELVLVAREKAANLHDVSLIPELQEDMPPVMFDQDRLQQALLNLINNALEASPQGEKVIVRCRCNGALIVIDIIDRGEGIPPEKRDDIFIPFVTTKKEGTGLGLPIVKKVVDAHGGTINILNNEEKGMVFRLTLPTVNE